MRFPRVICGIILCFLALIPLTTLFHHNDLGRWDTQRSAMAAPDEFSYLLMARHFLHGGGLSLQADLGRDTFYPPGYPLLLAAWGKCFGLTAFTAHALNTLLISAGTIVVYFFCRRLLLQLAQSERRPFTLAPHAASALALLIAGLFATNWHVLETSLLVMSEPAFMLATFAWLALALKWPDWPTHPFKALAIVLLAVCAWSIRGAGIVCVVTTFVYPLLDWFRQPSPPSPRLRGTFDRLGPLALAIGLPLAYQIVLAAAAREKSLVSGQESNNSYPRQLLRGLLVEAPGPNDPHPWLTLATAWIEHLYYLVTGHLKDYAASFVPWPREEPDATVRTYIGWIFGILGFIGGLFHVLRLCRRPSAPANAPQPTKGFLEIYIVLYVGLYLVWPFNFARFWSPILPIMLVYAADCVMRFRKHLPALPRMAPAALLLGLLLLLSGEELYHQLGFYARRLNYVSDALRDGVRRIIKTAPDPRQTLVTGMGDDELYALSWYFSQEPNGGGYRIRAPEPHLASKGGTYERADEMLLRCAAEIRAVTPNQSGSLFFFSYFPGDDARDTLASFSTLRPGDEVAKIYRKEAVVSVWLIQTKPSSTQGQTQAP